MDQEFKSKNATAEKTQVDLFNLLALSPTSIIPVVSEGVEEEYNFTVEVARRAKLFEKLREKAITRSLCLDMAGILLEEDNVKENDKFLTQLSNALFNCQTYKSNMRCDTRFCMSCVKRHSAEFIQRYIGELNTWKQPQFVTITIPSVSESELGETIDKMYREFSNIIAGLNKKYRRKGIRYLGLKMFECDFNAEEQTYSPHFHLIVENKIAAKQIIFRWKKRFSASDKGQDQQSIKEGTLPQIIAYCTKYFADKKINASSSADDTPIIHLKAYLNILKAMGKHKQFFRFGFNISEEFKQKEKRDEQTEKQERLIFDIETNTLFDYDTGKKVIAFNKVPYHLKSMLSNTNTDTS